MKKPDLQEIKEEAEEHFSDALACATDKAKEGCCALTDSVKQKPLVYLGFALAVGVALGAVLLSRRSS